MTAAPLELQSIVTEKMADFEALFPVKMLLWSSLCFNQVFFPGQNHCLCNHIFGRIYTFFYVFLKYGKPVVHFIKNIKPL